MVLNRIKIKKEHARVLATSMTALLFLVIGGSGVLMYFHLFDTLVKELHEVLGLLFVAAILFHLFYNWGSMKRYFSKKLFAFSTAAVVVMTSFFLFSAQGGENPKVIIIESVLNAPLEEVSHLFGVNTADARQRLEDQGISVSEQGSLNDIAKANARSPFALIQLMRQHEK